MQEIIRRDFDYYLEDLDAGKVEQEPLVFRI
jgi:hypothetical protein